MASFPSQYSVILMVMFSQDNCTHFIKNETFTNDCNTLSASSYNMCCQDLILDLFGDMEIGQCYQDTSYRNYSQIKFQCIDPPIFTKNIINYLSLIFIICGFIILMCCIIKWTQEVKESESESEKQRKKVEHITMLNQGYNIQTGQYKTFPEYQ